MNDGAVRADSTTDQRRDHDRWSDWLLNATNREKVALLMQRPGDTSGVVEIAAAAEGRAALRAGERREDELLVWTRWR